MARGADTPDLFNRNESYEKNGEISVRRMKFRRGLYALLWAGRLV